MCLDTQPTIPQIIHEGSLKSWWIDASFTEVYWSHEGLAENQYYLFTFTTHKHDLMSVKTVTRQQLPRRYRMKQMQPVIKRLMSELARTQTKAVQ
jgi:hypothetical protein